ncbi:SPOR domain-containing protein [Vibrio algarum]|uniref:SPOR domain-containing protein n=1 Tax=Vibrio algarum TaxID=3020714 RepID=A0ABT4YXH2_9VIBR|nr:SPOR domain-containing protein [Vibrio sp. KJ40-1]MDB1126290.1 SPOR domain-containing protein [Vibrio sp. KJ40-1]
MRNISIIALSVLLTACSSGELITDVTTESYKEEYKTEPMVEPMKETTVMEADVAVAASTTSVVEQQQVIKTQNSQPQRTSATHSSNKMIKILPPTQKQEAEHMRFGYTIQVMAVGSSQQAYSYAKQLPEGHSVWEHHKQVKGTDWYAVLYGDYATKSDAKAAIQTLPKYFRDLKPFVKSLDEIKKSAYPKLVKLK